MSLLRQVRRGIALILLYSLVVSLLAHGSLVTVNSLREKLGMHTIDEKEFFRENFINLLTAPHVVLGSLNKEADELSKKLSDMYSEQLRAEQKSNEEPSEERVQTVPEKPILNNTPEEEHIEPEVNTSLLASYLELLDAVAEKLRRFNLRAKLYLGDFSGEKYEKLSREEMLRLVEEKESRIDELARKTMRRRIDFDGVEINRFNGERYFVFVKNKADNLTVAQRPLVYSDPEENLEIFNRTLEEYSEIMGVRRMDKPATLYIWDYAENYRDALKPIHNWSAGTGTKRYGRIEIHVSVFDKTYNFIRTGKKLIEIKVHETTHALDFIYDKRPITPLLQEGFAEYMKIEIAEDNQPTFPWELSIKDCTMSFYDNAEYPGCYQYGYHFVRFLIEEYGVDKFRRIYSIRRYAYGYEPGWKYYNEKFKRVYGKGLEELDEEFRTWMKTY